MRSSLVCLAVALTLGWCNSSQAFHRRHHRGAYSCCCGPMVCSCFCTDLCAGCDGCNGCTECNGCNGSHDGKNGNGDADPKSMSRSVQGGRMLRGQSYNRRVYHVNSAYGQWKRQQRAEELARGEQERKADQFAKRRVSERAPLAKSAPTTSLRRPPIAFTDYRDASPAGTRNVPTDGKFVPGTVSRSP